MPKDALPSRNKSVRTDESSNIRIVVTGLEVIIAGLCVVIVAPVTDGIDFSYCTGAGQHLSPGIICVATGKDRGRFSVFVSYDLKYFSTIPLVVPVRRLSCLTETPFS